MSKSNPKINKFGVRGIHIIFIVLFICTTCSPAWAWNGVSSVIEWLLDLVAADAVPQRPTLTEEDRAAIEKTRVLLRDYPTDAGKSMLLGIFAAAEGNAGEAQHRFIQAAELDESGSLLPLTMAAQTHLQENNTAQAVEMHRHVLHQIQQRPQTPRIQAINAHLDLVVAYQRMKEPQRAAEQMERATDLLSTGEMSDMERGFAYLQLGVVQKEVLKKDGAAIEAWKAGSHAAAGNPRLALELNLKVVENLVRTDPNTAELYLHTAGRIARRFAGESQIAAQVKVGEQYARLATLAIRQKNPKAGLLSEKAEQFLEPALRLDDDASAQMIFYKTTALESARNLASAEGNETRRKEIDKRISTVRTDLSLKIVPPKKLEIVQPFKILEPNIR